ncbi:MAG: hypothetical protein ISR96_09875 [Nitrospira sp.]|nr:hypothetical protein [Nitrospira sp.]
MKKNLFVVSIFAVVLMFGMAEAVPTKVVVKARSKDAKFIGSSMGGAAIVLRDSVSGKVLAEGLTSGGTGDTKKIMLAPKGRYDLIGEGAAQFETILDISDPTLVTVEVEAPMSSRPDTVKSSVQVWIIPGRDMLKDSIVVEVPGFTIESNTPLSVQRIDFKAEIPVKARIVMI